MKPAGLRSYTAVLSLAALIAFGQPVAFAAEPDSEQATADEISRTVDAVAADPTDTTRVPVSSGDGGITAQGDMLNITIPTSDAGQVALSRPGSESETNVAIGLPSGSDQQSAVVAQDGTVTYDSSLRSTDVAVQAFDNGVRVQTVLSGPNAPTEFAYSVDVPAGGSMTISPDGGVLVVDAEGLPRGGFAAPWAKDSNGQDIPTHYEIRGSLVVQVVDHAGAAYPVVADPWLWIDLISSAAWSYDRVNSGWTLRVTPTRWARLQAGGYLPGKAGWNELYSKYKNRGLNTNLDGMRDQYICHQQFVAVRAPGRATWNLDEWRPNWSYLATVNASCNPGSGSSIFP